MTGTFAKLSTDIIYSSIWSEDDKVRLMWITMLALKDKNGNVKASIPGLARAANVPIEDCVRALKKFREPDQYSRSPEFEGRRIKDVPGGWNVLNHEQYKKLGQKEARKEQSRDLMRTYRENDSPLTDAELTAQFERFWLEYPRKQSKIDAKKAFERAIGKTTTEVIIAAVTAQSNGESWKQSCGKFIPHAATWLNGEKWNDVPMVTTSASRTITLANGRTYPLEGADPERKDFASDEQFTAEKAKFVTAQIQL